MELGKECIGVAVSAMIFNNRGEMFLRKRSANARNNKGKWAKPGGAVRYEESVKDCLRRNIKEDFGVDVIKLELVGYTDNFLEEEKEHWVGITFLAEIEGELQNLRPEQNEEIGWFPLDELPEELSRGTEHSIKRYREGKMLAAKK